MNFLYRANKWLDRSNYTLLLILAPIITANLLLTLTDFLWLGISLLSTVCILALIRIRIQTGQLKFDKNVYEIPSIGERVIIKRGFYWNGEFHKRCPKTDMGSKPWYFTIGTDGEWEIVDVKELDADWMIYLHKIEQGKSDPKSGSIHIKYFDSRKHWETKSNIRNNKLKRLGI